jgi:hypothetical protein
MTDVEPRPQRATPRLEVRAAEESPECPLRCGFETYNRDLMHDHVSDEHPELWEIVMSGEVFIYE